MLPQWNGLIVKTRAAFSGRLLYVAHNAEEAATVPFWDRLDAIGVSLYPPLGNDDDRDYRRAAAKPHATRIRITPTPQSNVTFSPTSFSSR